jgi:hypothetical protein
MVKTLVENLFTKIHSKEDAQRALATTSYDLLVQAAGKEVTGKSLTVLPDGQGLAVISYR